MPLDPPEAPDATFVRRRWIPTHRTEWAKQCAGIMREHGAVVSSNTYDVRHKARWRAQYLIGLLVELDYFERWQLREHTDRTEDGWKWTVEYVKENSHA